MVMIAGTQAPPPGPPPGTGLLFNFGQFSQRMPSQSSTDLSQYRAPSKAVVDLSGTEMPADANVVGDIQQWCLMTNVLTQWIHSGYTVDTVLKLKYARLFVLKNHWLAQQR